MERFGMMINCLSRWLKIHLKLRVITLSIDRSEYEIFIGHNPLLVDDQAMVHQVEQPPDEQEKRIKDAEIDGNDNNSEEEDEKEKEAIGIDFTERKCNPENAIDFRWSDIWGEGEEDIDKANSIKSSQKQADEEFFLKRVTVGLLYYYDIVPKEKKQNKNKKI